MAKTRTLLFFFKDPRGGTALEAALILPVFLIFLLGVCEMGLVFWGNSMIRNSLSQVAFESSRGCIEGNIDRMSGDCMDPGSAITRARLAPSACLTTISASRMAVRAKIREATLADTAASSNKAMA